MRALLLLAALSGCAQLEYPTHLLVRDPAAFDTVTAAALRWDSQLGGRAFTVHDGGEATDPCRDVVVYFVPAADFGADEDAHTNNRWSAFHCHRELRLKAEALTVDLLTHELGHLLQVPHNPDPCSVMHPLVASGAPILADDLAAARRTLGR